MSRVATIPIQRTMSDAIQRVQQQLASSQLQLTTQKKVNDYASLGTATVRVMSARTLVDRSEAHATVAKSVGTTLALYDASMTGIHDSISDMRQNILTAVGTGQSAGLQDSINGAFEFFRSALSGSQGGVPLFAGSRTDEPPFKPESLTDTLNYSAADAFGNDDIRVSARVSDDLDMEYGIVASEVGAGLFTAFRKLAEAGDIGPNPTPAQLAAMEEALGLLDTGLADLRAVNAGNGRKQAQIETIEERVGKRTLLLKDIIAQNEDADLGQVAIDLARHQTTLQASYSVFAQLSKMTLANFL